MSTVVLARKYRPKSFDQMVGQEHVVRALTNALQNNRLHHAYLFTGTRGIGKTTVSRILAKSLNCTGPDGQGGVTAHPCGVCSACTQIDADRYIDYLELDAASNRSIDEIRDLIERAAYKPGVGRFKVFMIDEAHQLTKDAFNALLKTLEEPPEYLKFVLATTDPDKMLPTVLSRCLQFNLRPMAPEVVREHLARVLQAEGVASDDGALRLLGRAARGSMRDALSLTDQAIAYGGGRLEEAVVRTMLGTVDRRHAAQLVQALAARDGRAVLAAVDALRVQGLSAAGTLEEMAALLQQMAVAQAVPDALDAADPEHEAPLALAPLLAADETQLLYSIALQGRAEIALMSDEYAALTMVLLRFLAFPAAGPAVARAPAAPVAAAPRRAPAPVAAAPVAAPAATPVTASVAAPNAAAAPAAARPAALYRPAPPPAPLRVAEPEPPPWVDDGPPPEFDAEPRTAPLRAPAPPALTVPAPRPAAAPLAAPETTPLGDRWAATVRRLSEQGRIAALVRELAWQAGVRAAADEADGGCCWTLLVERDSLRSDGTRDKLAAALTAELGVPQRLVLEAGVPADSVARRDAWDRQRRQAEAEHIIRGDPAVQELLSQFKTARIVPDSIRPL
ncbi:MAG: DNA polymerase III subunit gamma/tau [Proteobacteria bacterium]|nr:DNA polymerase III subunit gamma/tau [Pseudomonadota bacterium]